MTKIQKNLYAFTLIIVLLLIFLPAFALAQDTSPDFGTTERTGLICVPGDKIIDCIPRIYKFALAISGILAMGGIVVAGYYWMTAGANAEQKTHAKEMIFAVIYGLIILASAYVLLKFINPELINLKDPGRFENYAKPTETPLGQTTAISFPDWLRVGYQFTDLKKIDVKHEGDIVAAHLYLAEQKFTDNTPPFEFTVDPSKYAPGKYLLRVDGFDSNVKPYTITMPICIKACNVGR